MGYATALFLQDPANNCICAICHDVIEDAASLQCGHTFCGKCIRCSLEIKPECPNCRGAATGATPCYFAREAIGTLQVMCPEGEETGVDERCGISTTDHGKKRKTCELGADDDGALPFTRKGCQWKGSLKDIDSHKKNCDFVTIKCSVGGCTHQCQRKDMGSHLSSGAGIIMHFELMRKSIVAETKESMMEECQRCISEECDRKISEVTIELKNTMLLDANHLRYANDCRNWIEHKPDALFQFSIHQIQSRKHIVGLYCGIPGPTNSEWEGAIVPMIFCYNRQDQPPSCKFPKGICHPNITPSGTVIATFLNENGYWTPEMSLPEILFFVQQLLCHTDMTDPGQAEAYHMINNNPDTYSAKTRENAKSLFTKEEFFLHAFSNKFDNIIQKYDDDVPMICELDIIEKSEYISGRKPNLQICPVPPSFKDKNEGGLVIRFKGVCECSCCAWGQVFWGEARKLRFFFTSPFTGTGSKRKLIYGR